MAGKHLNLEIVTPQGRAFKGEALSVQLPGVMGQMGILVGHAPLLAMLEPGICSYTYLPAEKDSAKGEDGKPVNAQLVTGSGFVHVCEDQVDVFVELAEFPDSIPAPSTGTDEDLAIDSRENRLLEQARAKLRSSAPQPSES